ncbi:MAG: lytic transglycosylase domain-containing protein [Pseudomonadota bacterium]
MMHGFSSSLAPWALGLWCAFAGACAAQEAADASEEASPPAFRDFTFKRVKPPASGTRKFITVQIAPKAAAPSDTGSEAEAGATRAAAAPAPSRANDAYPWFWEAHATERSAAEAGRLFEALETIQGAGNAPAPRLQSLQTIADAYGATMLGSTVGTRVSPALVLAVISVESAGDVDAVSRAGAQGLMQLMPATADRFGVTDAFDAADNIKGGVALLDYLMGLYDDDPLLVLAAYNAGEGAVRDHGGVPPYPETRNYIPRVLAAYDVARGLCQTPPLLLTDGCVFARGEG